MVYMYIIDIIPQTANAYGVLAVNKDPVKRVAGISVARISPTVAYRCLPLPTQQKIIVEQFWLHGFRLPLPTVAYRCLPLPTQQKIIVEQFWLRGFRLPLPTAAYNCKELQREHKENTMKTQRKHK